MAKIKYELEKFDKSDFDARVAARRKRDFELYPDSFEPLTETAGFEPLEVKFKRMEQAGYKAALNMDEYTSADMYEFYLQHPEFDLNKYDDLETAKAKLDARNEFMKSYSEKILALDKKAEKVSEVDVSATQKAEISEKAADDVVSKLRKNLTKIVGKNSDVSVDELLNRLVE